MVWVCDWCPTSWPTASDLSRRIAACMCEVSGGGRSELHGARQPDGGGSLYRGVGDRCRWNGEGVEQDDEEQPCRCRYMPRVAQCLVPMVFGWVVRHVGGVCARETHHLFAHGSWCQTGGALLQCDQVLGLILPGCEASMI